MFRVKSKRSGTRKRKELAASDDEAPAAAPVVVNARSEAQEAQEAQEAAAVAGAAGDEEADAALDQMRRARALRGRGRGAMSFSSKPRKAAARSAAGAGVVSFDDDRDLGEARREKIRPNLIAPATQGAPDEGEGAPSRYSEEMLASLRQEQKVLLPKSRVVPDESPTRVSEVQPSAEIQDVEMEDPDADPVVVSIVEEDTKSEEAEEEFIPLQSQVMQRRRRKNRVSFGLDLHEPKIARTAEVIEDVGSGDDEQDESQRWEEELMRRGGLFPAATQPKSREEKKKRAYPTHKKLSCISLDSLLLSLDRSVEAIEFDTDRSNRELARIEADIANVDKDLKSQHDELLVFSEEFEYFQVIEDFVKGLSFCLREKLPVIETKENDVFEARAAKATTQRTDTFQMIVSGISKALARATITDSDIWCLQTSSSGIVAEILNTTEYSGNEVAEHFVEPYVPISPPRDVGSIDEFFGEAIDEISSLSRVYGRFQEWKSKFPNVYRDSYCDLAAEKLYAPYVRAEMLSWDPLSVAMQVPDKMASTWSLTDFEWFRVLTSHLSGKDAARFANDTPLLFQVREFIVERTTKAVAGYFDPCSGLQIQSLTSILESLAHFGLINALSLQIDELIARVLEKFASTAKSFVLLALNEPTATSHPAVRALGQHSLERFDVLQENLLNLFVALPDSPSSLRDSTFACLMQVLHLLLAYLSHCRQSGKTYFQPLATQVVSQIEQSSYLRESLSSSKRERELEHVMALFAPLLSTSTRSTSSN